MNGLAQMVRFHTRSYFAHQIGYSSSFLLSQDSFRPIFLVFFFAKALTSYSYSQDASVRALCEEPGTDTIKAVAPRRAEALTCSSGIALVYSILCGIWTSSCMVGCELRHSLSSLLKHRCSHFVFSAVFVIAGEPSRTRC